MRGILLRFERETERSDASGRRGKKGRRKRRGRLCVSYRGSWPSPFRDRRIDAIRRDSPTEGDCPLPSQCSSCSFSTRVRHTGKVSRNNKLTEKKRRIMMTERMMTAGRPNCGSRPSLVFRPVFRLKSLHRFLNEALIIIPFLRRAYIYIHTHLRFLMRCVLVSSRRSLSSHRSSSGRGVCTRVTLHEPYLDKESKVRSPPALSNR